MTVEPRDAIPIFWNGVIGIDPGAHGGLAVRYSDESFKNETIELHPLDPFYSKKSGWDLHGLADLFNSLYMPTCFKVYIEEAMPIYLPRNDLLRRGGSAAGSFAYGGGWYALRAMAMMCGYSVERIRPKAWLKLFGITAPDRKDREKQATVKASELWPQLDLRASKRATKPHSGLVAAMLIAEYGIRHQSLGVTV